MSKLDIAGDIALVLVLIVVGGYAFMKVYETLGEALVRAGYI